MDSQGTKQGRKERKKERKKDDTPRVIPKPKEKAGRANVPKTIVVTNLNIEWWRA